MSAGKASGFRALWICLLLAAVILSALATGARIDHASGIAGLIAAPGQPRRLAVSLSFDIEDAVDDNESISVPLILRILEEHGAKATFFITGKAADRNPGMVRMINQAGHEIGLHTNEHLFPVFDEDKAEKVAARYGTTFDYVWMMSYKSPAAFRRSLEANRAAIRRAVGDVSIISFRSPCLVASWGDRPEYFGALLQSGILVDSSILQDLSSSDSVLRGIYEREGVTQVPVTRGDDILRPGQMGIISRMQAAGIPAVLFFHPKGFGGYELARLDRLLSALESEHDTTYLTVAEAAGFTSA
ncbi:MAG: polysaccharide deacetylase family protein [Candidatus Aenigmarchaeota archaeon]|nr:polysaccharide deacetylase family protein [Candidatus Aenigmarchaeota archaeon]